MTTTEDSRDLTETVRIHDSEALVNSVAVTRLEESSLDDMTDEALINLYWDAKRDEKTLKLLRDRAESTAIRRIEAAHGTAMFHERFKVKVKYDPVVDHDALTAGLPEAVGPAAEGKYKPECRHECDHHKPKGRIWNMTATKPLAELNGEAKEIIEGATTRGTPHLEVTPKGPFV